MNKTKKLLTYSLLFATLLFPFSPALASSFNPSYIISDFEFVDYNSMDMSSIQRFLLTKGGTLGNYVDPFVKMTASQIIYLISQTSYINPKVLITLLQKEQSLVEDPFPSQDQYDWATGYGICDSCSKSDPALQKYKGFVNQIDWAASGLRFYLNHPNEFKYQIGSTYNIDGEKVTILNEATRALYIYTPHIAGNKNFWQIWQEWFAILYPDGSLLQDKSSGGIYFIQNGFRRPFLSKSAFTSRYSFDKIIPIESPDLERYPIGFPIKYSNYSLLQVPSGGVYLLVDETLRPIASREAFRMIGFNPEEIIPIKYEDIAGYPEGEKITIKSIYPTGALLQDKVSGGIYFVEEGIKYPLWSKEILKVNFSNRKIIPVSPDELEKYPKGDPIKFKDGELVKSFDSATVYIISNGKKRPIASVEAFEGLGYKWQNIIITTEKVLSLHLTGEIIDVIK